MYKLDLEKAEEPEIKLPTLVGLSRKQGNSKKTSTSASLTMRKPLSVWITTNCRRNFIAPSKCDAVYVENNSLGHVFMKLKLQIWANYNLIF